jgi:ASC-1-like (ASCH) protein
MKKISQSTFVTYKSHRADPYFGFVKNGQKTIEGRIKKGEYQFLKTGDHIVVCNEEETDSVEVLVKDLRNYNSVREMLECEPLKKVLPNVDTVDQGIEIYKQFYTEEQQQEFGVIAIEVGGLEV